MEKLSSITKGGWHPQKTGSIRGDIKSMVGRGGDAGFSQARERAQSHQTTPLSALKDPSSFAPPPKHTGYYSSNDGTGVEVSQSPVAFESTASRPLPVRPNAASTPVDQQTDEEETPRSGPFVVDTTGLSTSHLPKPPVKRAGTLPLQASEQLPIRRPTAAPVSANSNLVSAAKAKKPGPPLPPRLPPRSAVAGGSPATPLSPPPSYSVATTLPATASRSGDLQQADTLINQDAIGRLGAAGISVPGFNIVSNRSLPNTPHADGQSSPSTTDAPGIQSRIAALGPAVAAASADKSQGLEMLAAKKKPAIPPTKPVLPNIAATSQSSTQENKLQPPPIPLGTKPR